MLTDRGIRTCAGLVNPNCTAFIGNGVVVHIPAFFEELDNLTKKGEWTIARARRCCRR